MVERRRGARATWRDSIDSCWKGGSIHVLQGDAEGDGREELVFWGKYTVTGFQVKVSRNCCWTAAKY